MLQWKIFRYRWLAVSWFVFITFLFFLPGSTLPRETWFSKIQLDKWLHTGVFAVLLFLWRSAFDAGGRYYNALLLCLAVIYGFLVEIIQREWVPNRDFDVYDLLCDFAGSVLGLIVWLRVYKKNKPL